MTTPAQRRDGAGRYASMPARAPELLLGDGVRPGVRVSYDGVPGCRVIDDAGDMLTLRPPRGGRAIATRAEVTLMPETEAQQQENIRDEASIVRMLAAVAQLSRSRREPLERIGEESRAALAEIGALASGGTDAERYAYAVHSTRGAPAAARCAAVAIVMRRHLSAQQYRTMTAPVRTVGAPLPA